MVAVTSFQKLFLVVCFIIALSVAYYFIIYLPRRDQEKINFANSAIQLRANCIQQAYQAYTTEWNSNCTGDGFEKSCTLPMQQANAITKNYMSAKDDCFRLYPS